MQDRHGSNIFYGDLLQVFLFEDLDDLKHKDIVLYLKPAFLGTGFQFVRLDNIHEYRHPEILMHPNRQILRSEQGEWELV